MIHLTGELDTLADGGFVTDAALVRGVATAASLVDPLAKLAGIEEGALASGSVTTIANARAAAAVGAIPPASSTTSGLATATQIEKLDGIESGALASTAVTTIANARAASAVGAIPPATTLVNGLATTAQITKLDGIEAGALAATAVTNIATNVATGLFSTESVLSWYLANWAVTDWYLDSVNGSDTNNGTTSGTALATTEELSRRLAIALPISHPVTVHVAQGTYGTLAVNVIQTAVACPFDVVGTPLLTSIGTVTSYADRVVATNTSPMLVASGVSDWTAHVGKMIVVTDGASAGAVTWIAKANPNNGAGVAQGVGTARCSSFSTVATNLNGTRKVPATGAALSVATLPTVKKISIRCSGQLPELFANTYASRLCRVANLSVESVTLGGGRGLLVESCELGNVEFLQHRNTYAQTIDRCNLKAWPGLPVVEMGMAEINYCLVSGSPNTGLKLTDGRIYYSLVQGAYLALEQSLALDVGIFDQPGASSGACQIISGRSARCTMASIYGRDNAGEGITINNTSSINATSLNYITGASGDIRVAAATPYFLPHSALPWVDGERSGEATMVAGTVDVTVPYVISTQKMQATYKTFAGTPGFLTCVYVDATHIRITSSSATDTSVVTWHILPVGDNVVIRS
jgi:hypothetical protein